MLRWLLGNESIIDPVCDQEALNALSKLSGGLSAQWLNQLVAMCRSCVELAVPEIQFQFKTRSCVHDTRRKASQRRVVPWSRPETNEYSNNPPVIIARVVRSISGSRCGLECQRTSHCHVDEKSWISVPRDVTFVATRWNAGDVITCARFLSSE